MLGHKILALLLTPLFLARTKKAARPKTVVPKRKSGKKAHAPKTVKPILKGTKGKFKPFKKPVGRTPPPPTPPIPKPKIEVVLPFEKKGKLFSPAIAPKPISPTNTVRIPGHAARFGWMSVAQAAHYQVTWGSEPTLVNSRSLLVTETAATLPEDHTLAPGKTFYWRVRAGNESGWGPWSVIQEFGTLEEDQEHD